MESKNKILFLIVGIVIGALTMFLGTALFNCESTEDFDDPHALTIIENEQSNKEEGHGEERVTLSENEIKELGIVTEKVGSKRLKQYKDLTGEIVPNPDKLVHVVPRFAGIVRKVNIEIGDKVKKDEVIAIIESNESLVTYDVKSSIDGVILDLHMTPGELMGDHEHVVTIADLRYVWAELNVYQKDLMEIKINQKANIYFDTIESGVTTKIFYLSPTLDEVTRTATARARLNNKDGYWKPGMFISAHVLTKSVEVKRAVTLNAIQNYEGEKVVFVKEGKSFKPQSVTIGKVNEKYAEILTGLKKGDIYISEGSFVIKSELLKESFGGGHNH